MMFIFVSFALLAVSISALIKGFLKKEGSLIALFSFTTFISFGLSIASIKEFEKEESKPEYKIELLNQEQVRINNDTIPFNKIEEYIELDNL